MKAAFIESRPVWLEATRPQFPTLAANASFDVVIVGGGITGLTAAYLLKQAGKRVAVLERGRIGEAETGHTTAHLTYVTDTKLSQLMQHFGMKEAGIAWLGGAMAIQTIESIIEEEQIECGFRRVPGYLHAAITKQADETEQLESEAALACDVGMEATFIPQVPIFDRPGVRYDNQALFHPIEYLSHLAQSVQGDGCEIFEQTEMTETKADPLTVTACGHTLSCDKLLIATHVPMLGLNDLLHGTLFQSKLAGYSTYAIGASIPSGIVPQGSYWDTDDPYYYLRVHAREYDDYVVFGGEDHKTGHETDAERRYAHLESILLQYLPQATVDHRWSGQVIETLDGLPYIGPVNEQQFIATGYSGNGMTFGTLAGVMACDWVLGKQNPWQNLFSIERKSITGDAWEYVKENAGVPYHLLKSYLTTLAGGTLDDIQKGQGQVLKIDGHRCAVHRDKFGELTACSAICTHMGCVVQWNSAEETWDCPCHGSRFGTDGHVIAGPAETPLEKRQVN